MLVSVSFVTQTKMNCNVWATSFFVFMIWNAILSIREVWIAQMFLIVTGVVPGMLPVEIMCGGRNGRPSTVAGCPGFSSLLQQVRSHTSDSTHSRKGYKHYNSFIFNYSKSKKYAKIRN